jgi:hypothetical protein
MSFSGAFVATENVKAKRGELPTKRRTEVSLREYGPTPFPAYTAAKIVGVRADLDLLPTDELCEYLASLPDETRAQIVRSLGPADPRTANDDPAAPRTVDVSITRDSRARRLALLNLRKDAA